MSKKDKVQINFEFKTIFDPKRFSPKTVVSKKFSKKIIFVQNDKGPLKIGCKKPSQDHGPRGPWSCHIKGKHHHLEICLEAPRKVHFWGFS